MSESKQFCELPGDPVAKFDSLFRESLDSLLADLADYPYYIREREVINLFVFNHLIPRLQANDLDIGQLGIEVPMQRMGLDGQPKFGRNGDIAVWPHAKATRCHTCKPLALIEWKNISCRENNSPKLEKDHQKDIDFLTKCSPLIFVGYAVLTQQRDGYAKASWTQVLEKTRSSDSLSRKTTYHQSIVDELSRPWEELGAKPQNCRRCLSWTRRPRTPDTEKG